MLNCYVSGHYNGDVVWVLNCYVSGHYNGDVVWGIDVSVWRPVVKYLVS